MSAREAQIRQSEIKTAAYWLKEYLHQYHVDPTPHEKYLEWLRGEFRKAQKHDLNAPIVTED